MANGIKWVPTSDDVLPDFTESRCSIHNERLVIGRYCHIVKLQQWSKIKATLGSESIVDNDKYMYVCMLDRAFNVLEKPELTKQASQLIDANVLK